MTEKFIPAGNMSALVLNTAATAISTVSAAGPTPEETFAEWLQRNVKEYPLTLDLPPEVWQWTALIITYWSVAEWIQLGTIARLLGMGRKEARVMWGARIGNLTGKIREVLQTKGLKVATDFDSLAETLTECEKRRNLLGHGVWLIDEDRNLCVENPSGEWTPPKEKPITRRKFPQAFHPTLPWFVETFADIKTSIRALQQLDLEIETALSASLGKGG